jgi:hypothetical protein
MGVSCTLQQAQGKRFVFKMVSLLRSMSAWVVVRLAVLTQAINNELT